jgi:hypothetical protein
MLTVYLAGYEVGYKGDEARREAALGYKVHLHFFNDDYLVLNEGVSTALCDRVNVVLFAFWFDQLNAESHASL